MERRDTVAVGQKRARPPVGYRVWSQWHGAASSSNNGSNEGNQKGPAKKVESAPMAKGYTTQQEPISELQRLLDGKATLPPQDLQSPDGREREGLESVNALVEAGR